MENWEKEDHNRIGDYLHTWYKMLSVFMVNTKKLVTWLWLLNKTNCTYCTVANIESQKCFHGHQNFLLPHPRRKFQNIWFIPRIIKRGLFFITENCNSEMFCYLCSPFKGSEIYINCSLIFHTKLLVLLRYKSEHCS